MTAMAEQSRTIAALDEIASQSAAKGRPSLGRLATVRAMLDLGEKWQSYSEIHRAVAKYTKSQGDYMYELQRRYPNIFEKSPDNLLRIRPNAFETVKKHMPECWAKVTAATEAGRK